MKNIELAFLRNAKTNKIVKRKTQGAEREE